jgi:hypothetical protein
MLMHNMTPHIHAGEAEALNLPQKESSFPDFLDVLGDDLGIEHLENLILEQSDDLNADLIQYTSVDLFTPEFELPSIIQAIPFLPLQGYVWEEKTLLNSSFYSNVSGRAPPFCV